MCILRSVPGASRLLMPVLLLLAAVVAAEPLTLSEAERLLRATPPPTVVAATARAQTLGEQADIVRALPPPQLLLGFEDMPVTGSGAWRLPPDGDGMAVAGVMQMFPSGKRRELLGARTRHAADAAAARRDAIARDALRALRLAWIDRWLAEQSVALAERATVERERLLSARDAAYRAGRTTLAERAQAALALALARDAATRLQQDVVTARFQLARWIDNGVTITGTMTEAIEFPGLPSPPTEAELLAGLDAHPELVSAAQEQQARHTETDLARAGARPDWRLDARYGFRGDMPDTASVMLGIELPLASAGRRRHEIAGALAAGEESVAQREDLLRRLRTDIRTASHHHSLLTARLAALDANALAEAVRGSEAALAGYRSGRDDFAALIDTRLAALDIEQMRIALQAELQKTRADLFYFSPTLAQEP